MELAKLRWIEGWSREMLASRSGKTEDAIQNYFQDLKRRNFQNFGLTPKEVKTIKKTVGGINVPFVCNSGQPDEEF